MQLLLLLVIYELTRGSDVEEAFTDYPITRECVNFNFQNDVIL